MPIRYLTGRSRALKPRLYAELKAALASPGSEPLIVLVPEQYTLQSEMEIMDALALEGSFRLQVMSPARLFSRIFEETGKPALVKIDERGRVMLMHAALSSLKKELSWYRGAQHRPGFSELAAAQVRELKQAGYTPEKLSALCPSLPAGPLRSKLGDLAVIWQAYDASLENRFMDGEDELNRALERVEKAGFLKGARVWAHGFELVSPTLAATLAALAATREVALLLPLDSDETARDFDSFRPVQHSFERLCRLIVEKNIDWSRECLPEPPEQNTSAELRHLRREINCFPAQSFPLPPRQIRLASCRNPLEEAMLAFATLRDRVMAGKMRYRDAAIACFDLPAYADALERAAALYDVPLFLENSRGADRNPLARYVLSALRLIGSGWQDEDARALMRTGYCALTDEEADRLANCAVEQGLRGMLWKKPLHRYRDERDEQLEPLRRKFAEPLTAFEADFAAAKNTRGQLEAVWALLERTGAHETLARQQTCLAQAGLLESANENAQVWNRLLSTFDQLCELMGETVLSARDLYELLSQSLAASDIKPLPQSGDAVMAGSLSHLRTNRLTLLFVLGCNERHGAAAGGLFQPHERELLGGEKDIWLAPDVMERNRLSAIDLSATLALADRHVIFCYSQSDAEGAALLPGALIGRLRSIFPALTDSGGLSGGEKIGRLLLNAPDAALTLLSARLSQGELTASETGALSALGRLPALSSRLAGLREASVRRAVSADIDRATARALYGGPRSVSVTRLERFAACPFLHFVQYGLRPEKLEPYALKKSDEGTFYHEALEDFLRATEGALSGLTAEEAVARMDEVSERLLAPLMDGPLGDNPVMLSHSRRLRCVARRAAQVVTRHLSGSRFTPCALEVSFGEYSPAIILHTQSGDVPLQGRIDRIDAWNDGDETWLRVIDYKSGLSEMNLSRLYFGLQLQLIIYLAVALEKSGSHPAGAFYFKVADPLVQSESRDTAEIEAERTRELRLSGLYIENQAVLSAMSPAVDQIVSLKLKKDGSPAASAAMLDEDGFSLLIRHALRAAEALTQGIMAGRTAIDPKRMSGFCSCDRCDWRLICQQDPLLGGMPRPLTPPVRQADVLERIREDFLSGDEA